MKDAFQTGDSVIDLNSVLERWSSQARKGYLEMLLLARLKAGRAYGYEIVSALKLAPGFEHLAEGTVYPVLTRMKKDALVTAEWVAEDTGPPRKYYTITPTGTLALDSMRTTWNRMTDILDAQEPGR